MPVAAAAHLMEQVDHPVEMASAALAIFAGLRRLLYRVDHPSPAQYGVSSTALQRMTMAVEALTDFQHPAQDASCRRVVRFLSTLVPSDVPEHRVADVVTQVCDHPGLPLDVVRTILAGEGREVSASVLRDIADRLRAGQPYDHGTPGNITESTGVSDTVVRQVSLWLGVVDAKAERLADAAAEFVEERDGTIAEFASEHGIGTTYAGKLLRDARKTDSILL